MIKGVIRVGVVHAPLLGETFTARIGHGAFLNDKKVLLSLHLRHMHDMMTHIC
jgi:fructose-1,6-bisphosphatase/inositol monophosphatase family enzyme